MAFRWLFFSEKKIARIAQRLEASPLGPQYMSSCSKCQKRSDYHPNGVKMAVFSRKKIRRIAQRLEASPPSHHTCHHVQNVKNVQNVIQIA